MLTGYFSVSSILVLCLMLGYFYFSYLIRIVMFFNRYRSLDCFAVLSGKVFLQFLLLWRSILVPPPPRCFFIPFGQTCSTMWMCVPSAGCWHYSIFVLYCEERERERKPTRCNNQMFIINTVSTCFGHHYAHLQENKDVCYCMRCAALVLLDVVGSGCRALRCGVRALSRWA